MMKTSFENIKIEGVLPVIIQDEDTKVVLETAFMNQNALDKSLPGKACYFLRDTLLEKHPEFQVQEVSLNEKKSVLLVKVSSIHPKGKSQWGELNEGKGKFSFLSKLEKIIEQYSFYGDKKSYRCPLFRTSLNKIVQKLGEEATEFIIEAKDDHNDKKFLNEAADLIFHFLVLLNAKGRHFDDVLKILHKREQKGKLKRKIERLKDKIRKHNHHLK